MRNFWSFSIISVALMFAPLIQEACGIEELPPNSTTADVDLVFLTVAMPFSAVKGSPVDLRVYILNRSHEIRTSIASVEVFESDSKTKIVANDKGKHLFGETFDLTRFCRARIFPGDGGHWKADLQKCYNFGSGRYKIIVKIKIVFMETGLERELATEPLEFTIKELPPP